MTYTGGLKLRTMNQTTIRYLMTHVEHKLSTNHSQLNSKISMLNKNTPGAKKSETKLEAPVSSYSYMRLKSVISG